MTSFWKQSIILFNIDLDFSGLNSGEGGGGDRGGLNFLLPVRCTLGSLPLWFCRFVLCNVAKENSYFSRFLPPWEPHFLSSLLPPPVDFLDFLPPLLPVPPPPPWPPLKNIMCKQTSFYALLTARCKLSGNR